MAEVAKEQHRLRELYLKSPTVFKEEVKVKCVKDFKAFVLKKAPKMLVHEEQECLVCDCQCPRRPPLYDDSLWMELISPSCIHWSAQGGHLGWLGEANLPLLAWAIGLRNDKYRPDMTCLECTPQLRAELPFLRALSGDKLEWYSTVMGPKHVGVPCGGQRVWVISAMNRLAFPGGPFCDQVVARCAFRTVVGTPSMFLSSGKEQVAGYLDSINENREKLQKAKSGKRFRAEDYLGASASARLHFHSLRAANERLKHPELLVVRMFMDISQNVNYSKTLDGSLPRQLTSTSVWIEDVERPMLPEELVAAQGR